MAGEPVATIGGGGFYLRLAIPERHADLLRQNAAIRIGSDAGEASGQLVKIYPQLENGRVIADAEVDRLDTSYVNARILVEVPVGERQAILVPESAITSRSGIDFITVLDAGKEAARAVVTGEKLEIGGKRLVEILTGLGAGESIVVPE